MKQKILSLFLFSNKLKFSEIEKSLRERSNKLTYHLNQLVKKNILVKNNSTYSLSETSEYLIPYLSEKNSPLPVILIQIKNKNHVFLYKRNKRPFLGKLSLPGGRLLVGENLKQAVNRIMKKHNITAKLTQINSVSLEHVKKKNNKLHSFLLIFTTATTKDKINFTDINKNKSKIISSDYKLITEDEDEKVKIKEFLTKS